MTRRELALRKELAVMHLRVARAELDLARAPKNDALSDVAPAIGWLSTLLEGRQFGSWGRSLRYALRIVKIALDVRHLVRGSSSAHNAGAPAPVVKAPRASESTPRRGNARRPGISATGQHS